MKKKCPDCFADISSTASICPYCAYKQADEKLRPEGALPLFYTLTNREKKYTYQIGRVLGKGAFSLVYSAYAQPLNKVVVIKEYYPSRLVSRSKDKVSIDIYPSCSELFADYLERQQEESKYLQECSNLKITGVVRFYGSFCDGDGFYMVLEKILGIPLSKLVPVAQRGIQALAFLPPLLNTLKDLHCSNMIHRDISPGNVFLRKNEQGVALTNQPVLLDFGMGRFDNDLHSKIPAPSLGTQGFRAPEVLDRNSKNLTSACDIYSLGALLYFSLLGKPPADVEDRLVQDNVQVPTLGGDKIAHTLHTLVCDCLQLEFTHRPTAEKLLSDKKYLVLWKAVTPEAPVFNDSVIADNPPPIYTKKEGGEKSLFNKQLVKNLLVILLLLLGIFVIYQLVPLPLDKHQELPVEALIINSPVETDVSKQKKPLVSQETLINLNKKPVGIMSKTNKVTPTERMQASQPKPTVNFDLKRAINWPIPPANIIQSMHFSNDPLGLYDDPNELQVVNKLATGQTYKIDIQLKQDAYLLMIYQDSLGQWFIDVGCQTEISQKNKIPALARKIWQLDQHTGLEKYWVFAWRQVPKALWQQFKPLCALERGLMMNADLRYLSDYLSQDYPQFDWQVMELEHYDTPLRR